MTDPYWTDCNNSLHSWFTSIPSQKLQQYPYILEGKQHVTNGRRPQLYIITLLNTRMIVLDQFKVTLAWVQQLCAVTLHFLSPAMKSLVALESASAFMFAIPAQCSTVYSYGCRAKLHLQNLGFPSLRCPNHSREQ